MCMIVGQLQTKPLWRDPEFWRENRLSERGRFWTPIIRSSRSYGLVYGSKRTPVRRGPVRTRAEVFVCTWHIWSEWSPKFSGTTPSSSSRRLHMFWLTISWGGTGTSGEREGSDRSVCTVLSTVRFVSTCKNILTFNKTSRVTKDPKWYLHRSVRVVKDSVKETRRLRIIRRLYLSRTTRKLKVWNHLSNSLWNVGQRYDSSVVQKGVRKRLFPENLATLTSL